MLQKSPWCTLPKTNGLFSGGGLLLLGMVFPCKFRLLLPKRTASERTASISSAAAMRRWLKRRLLPKLPTRRKTPWRRAAWMDGGNQTCGKKRGRFFAGFWGGFVFQQVKVGWNIYFLLWESLMNQLVIMRWDRGLFLVSHLRSRIHSITLLERPHLLHLTNEWKQRFFWFWTSWGW